GLRWVWDTAGRIGQCGGSAEDLCRVDGARVYGRADAEDCGRESAARDGCGTEQGRVADYFEARISIRSMRRSLALAKSSGAFAMRALAIWPLRCASRPASSLKVSKTPYIPGAILTPYHVTVPGSSFESVAPCSRN